MDVLGVDGNDGAAALRALAGEHHLASSGPLVRTGSGGWHYYMQPTGLGNVAPRDLAHVDWRGRGGYVVAPPSRHASGGTYRFVRGLEHPIPPVPEVLRARLDPPVRQTPTPAALQLPTVGHPYVTTALARECEQLAATPPDSKRRNHTLYTAGLRLHSLAAGGALDPGEVDTRLLAAARTCGLGEREAQATLASARRVAEQHPRGIPDRQPTARQDRRSRVNQAAAERER